MKTMMMINWKKQDFDTYSAKFQCKVFVVYRISDRTWGLMVNEKMKKLAYHKDNSEETTDQLFAIDNIEEINVIVKQF
jgi:hypothetical protein